MAKYISDVNGILTEILPLIQASIPYPTPDATTTARNNATDATKMIELTAAGVIHKDFLPYRFITVGGSAGHSGMSAILDSTGRWDISLMPVGIGAEVIIDTTTDTLSAGNFCNIHSGGIRLATNTSAPFHANGFVLSGFAASVTATMFGVSNINTVVSAAKGSTYYLGTAGGIILAVALPTANGNIVQRLGTAHSTSAMLFNNTDFHVRNAT